MINNYNDSSENFLENMNFSEEVLYKKIVEENQNIFNFIVNISHDLRTPISVILNTIKVLKMHLNNSSLLPEEVKRNEFKYLYIIQQNSYRMLRLFNSILDVAKIESGGENLNLQNNDIVSVIRNICSSVNQLSNTNGVSLTFSSDLDKKVIAFDPDKIERIILNLLTNAFKFTNPGGEIIVSLTQEGDNIKISVKDTGTGIPRKQLNCIFEKFKNGGKMYDNVYCKGIGVGLYVVKLFVELHNGKIDVKSKEGKGTEFIITLPITLVEENKTAPCLINEIIDNKFIETINIEFADVYKANVPSIHNQTAG
ncbi:MAG: sensor histidine kinase [Deltaproteobacteria bacterium]